MTRRQTNLLFSLKTVGIAGGYIAGGGHSPMMSLVGMGADQVLSMEVVLPSGQFVTASATSNPELFWALRGGGGGTFGVVTSVVIQAYPRIPVTTMSLAFGMSETLDGDLFAGLRSFFSHFPDFTEAGSFSYFFIVPNGLGGHLFLLVPLWGGNMTRPELEDLTAPWLAELEDLGIPVTPNFTEYTSMYSAFNGTWPGGEAVGAITSHAASRLFPRDNFADSAKLDATLAAIRYSVEEGGILIGYNIHPAPNAGANQDNAVNPAWRDARAFFMTTNTWGNDATHQEIADKLETVTTDWMEAWRAVTPGGGTYMSEGDINEPNFQQAFYGSNYARLYALKQQLDPAGLFYAPTAVGSEHWYITGQIPYWPTQNGRLCRRE